MARFANIPPAPVQFALLRRRSKYALRALPSNSKSHVGELENRSTCLQGVIEQI
jgi:hypothetical protein